MNSTKERGITIDMLDRAPDDTPDYAAPWLDKLFAAMQPGAVFGTPVVSGNYTVITASEVGGGGGFGAGRSMMAKAPGQDSAVTNPAVEGGGSGGGGGSGARPIAAIVIGPDGVAVKPIFDLTKIVLAGIAALGALVAALLRMRTGRR